MKIANAINAESPEIMTDLAALKAANEKRWANAKLTRGPEFAKYATIAVNNKARYQDVERRCGVHWVFVAVSHYRESSMNFSRQLGQGDPLDHVSTHVPAGRGPFLGPRAFEDCAVDALVACSPYAARNKDWTIGGLLTLLERYNGIGYAARGKPSPYIWAGTDQYSSGKYVRDGVYDPNAVDQQLGCAGLIKAMMELDPSIKFDGSVISQPSPVPAGIVRDGAWLQDSLNKLGANPQLQVDGSVGQNTRNAVRAFQLAQGIYIDGRAGSETFAAIDKALAAGKPVPTIPVPPEIVLPPPGTQAHANLAPTFWGRVFDLFKPKVN